MNVYTDRSPRRVRVVSNTLAPIGREWRMRELRPEGEAFAKPDNIHGELSAKEIGP